MPDDEVEWSCIEYLTAIVHIRSAKTGIRVGMKPLSRDVGLNVTVQE